MTKNTDNDQILNSKPDLIQTLSEKGGNSEKNQLSKFLTLRAKRVNRSKRKTKPLPIKLQDEQNTEHFAKIKDIFKAYEDGKSRRYSLLFAVNGGAFAIAKLLGDDKIPKVFNGLSIYPLAIGMIVFTSLMSYDILKFGEKMKSYLPSLFQDAGKIVLLGMCGFIVAGWLLMMIQAVFNIYIEQRTITILIPF